jgi:hypothetical protein
MAACTDMTRDELWALIEPLVQAAITERLIAFHAALVSRGQIPAPADLPSQEGSGAINPQERSSSDTGSDRALQRDAPLRRVN